MFGLEKTKRTKATNRIGRSRAKRKRDRDKDIESDSDFFSVSKKRVSRSSRNTAKRVISQSPKPLRPIIKTRKTIKNKSVTVVGGKVDTKSSLRVNKKPEGIPTNANARKVVTTISNNKKNLRKRRNLITVTFLLLSVGLISSFLFGIYGEGQIDVAEVISNRNNRLLAENPKGIIVGTQNDLQKPDGGLVGLNPSSDKKPETALPASTSSINNNNVDSATSSEITADTLVSGADDILDTENYNSNTFVKNMSTSSVKATSSIVVGNNTPEVTSIIIE